MGTYEGQPVLFEQLFEWISDTQRLNGDGSFSRISVYRNTLRASTNLGEILVDTVTTHAAHGTGTFTVAERTIELTLSEGGSWTGSVAFDMLTVTVASGDRWVYRR
jgi:hypothetical protein